MDRKSGRGAKSAAGLRDPPLLEAAVGREPALNAELGIKIDVTMGRVVDEVGIRDQHLHIAAAAAAGEILDSDPAVDAGIEVEGQTVGMSTGKTGARREIAQAARLLLPDLQLVERQERIDGAAGLVDVEDELPIRDTLDGPVRPVADDDRHVGQQQRMVELALLIELVGGRVRVIALLDAGMLNLHERVEQPGP